VRAARLIPRLGALALALALAGCVHAAKPAEPVPSALPPDLAVPLAPLVMADARGAADLASPTPSAVPAKGRGKYRFRATPVADAIRLLFAGSDLNVMIEDGVEGSVTADFTGATPEQVLAALLKNQGLSMTYEDGYARIGRQDRRVFNLDYVAGDAYASLWGEISDQVKALLTPDGKVTTSPATGTLIVEDRAENLDRVEQHLRDLEEIIGRQVLIEAKVIEVTLNDSYQMGLDLGLFPRTVGAHSGIGGSTGTGAAVLQQFAPSVGGIQLGVFRTGDFSLLLEALHTQGQVNMLSSPRVSTLNNHAATINVTEQVPVISREVVSGEVDATSTREVYDVTFEEAGIQLDVTPQISADGSLTIRVHPRVTEVSGSVTTPDKLQTLPIFNQRETETVLKVRDGESIALGGFIQKRRREEVLKVPGLGDLPLVGPLFRSTDQREDRVELLILLTPKVLDSNGIAQAVAEGLDGITELARPFHFGILSGTTFDLVPGTRGSGFTPAMVLPAAPAERPAGGFTRVTRSGLARYHLEAGMAYLRESEPERAEREWSKALRYDPGLAEARFQLALLYAQRAQTGRALRFFNEIAGERPAHPQGLNRIALALTAAGAFDPAIRVLKQGLRDFPENPALLTNLGVCYLGKGEPDLAEAAFSRASRTDPQAVEPAVDRAEILLSRGGLEAARRIYADAIQRVPAGNPEFYQALDRRIRAIDRALGPDPNDAPGVPKVSDTAPATPVSPKAKSPAPGPQPDAHATT
jgi:MSHA biogenesis protein MshL